MHQQNHASPKKGNLKNEIARFRTLRPRNLAISNPPVRQKLTRAQCLRNCSRTTIQAVISIGGHAALCPPYTLTMRGEITAKSDSRTAWSARAADWQKTPPACSPP